MSEWISVKDRMPENEQTVLICAEVRPARQKTFRVIVMAFYTNGKTNTEDSSYSWNFSHYDAEYDEENAAYIIPEGWWESVRYGEEFVSVSDYVTHWMPLPDPPGRDDIPDPNFRQAPGGSVDELRADGSTHDFGRG